MRRLRFLVEEPLAARAEGDVVALPAAEARHLARSLRGAPGASIHLFDGAGHGWSAEVVRLSSTTVEARLVAPDELTVEPPLRLVLLQALSRDDDFAEAVVQATALGVARIVPLLCERALGNATARGAARVDRWRRIAVETAKLSWRTRVPEIAGPVPVRFPPPLPSAGALGFVLDTEARAGSLREALAGPPPQEVDLVVGPEGGFSSPEIEALTSAGYRRVSLGPRILRTRHAGAAALAAVLAAWGDLG